MRIRTDGFIISLFFCSRFTMRSARQWEGLRNAAPRKTPQGAAICNRRPIKAGGYKPPFLEVCPPLKANNSRRPPAFERDGRARTAVMNKIMRRALIGGSGVLEDHLQNDVSGVAAAVDDFFQKLVEIAQEDDL